MSYANIFQKLDQDIAEKLQKLQAQQKELLEKKKSLSTIQQEIQNFLTSAKEVKKLVESEPELFKSVRAELAQIFALNNNSASSSPQLPRQKPEISTPIRESKLEQITAPALSSRQSVNLEEEAEDESINDFTFVDAQGKDMSKITENE